MCGTVEMRVCALRIALAGVALMLILTACQGDKVVRPPQIIARIHSTAEVRREMDRLRVTVATPGLGEVWNRSEVKGTELAGVSLRGLVWPIDIPIYPEGGTPRSIHVEVVVEALQDERVLVQARAVVTWFERGVRILDIWLTRCGDRELSTICERDENCHGPDCKVCIEGLCIDTGITEGHLLLPWSEDSGPPLDDAGLPTGVRGSDGGSDSGRDSGRDGGRDGERDGGRDGGRDAAGNDDVEAGTCEAASDATCNGVDDDCDGDLDEDFVSAPSTCGQGACASVGVVTCVEGDQSDSCSPGTAGANDATCDGVDDDCDGDIDEDFVSAPSTCGRGACASAGVVTCDAGDESDSCSPGTPGANDVTCDGVDDDCNGSPDEDYVAASCGTGACASESACTGASETPCMVGDALSNVDTTCDAVDDDCDGSDDEDSCGANGVCVLGSCACDLGYVANGDVCEPSTCQLDAAYEEPWNARLEIAAVAPKTQTFTIATAGVLSRIEIVGIEHHDGVWTEPLLLSVLGVTNAIPDQALIADIPIDPSSIPTDTQGEVSVDISSFGVQVAPGDRLAIRLTTTGAARYAWTAVAPGSYSGGRVFLGSSPTEMDLRFRAYVCAASLQ